MNGTDLGEHVVYYLIRWGVYDVDDCYHGAMHLVDIGQANSQYVCIAGKSAGGYSALNSVTFKSVYKAGM